jgi:hypothetical protein
MDRIDVAEMMTRGLVEPARLRSMFEAIQPMLIRYPAINPARFRARLEEFLG